MFVHRSAYTGFQLNEINYRRVICKYSELLFTQHSMLCMNYNSSTNFLKPWLQWWCTYQHKPHSTKRTCIPLLVKICIIMLHIEWYGIWRLGHANVFEYQWGFAKQNSFLNIFFITTRTHNTHFFQILTETVTYIYNYWP